MWKPAFWLCLLLATQMCTSNTESWIHIAQLPECQEDIAKYCRDISKTSDIAIIECLQDTNEDEATPTTSACQQTVWEFMKNLTQGQHFKTSASNFCAHEMHEIPEMGECANEKKPGFRLSCMLDFKANVTTQKCSKFLRRTHHLAFSDFRLVGQFVRHCLQFLKAFECGSIEPPPIEGEHHSQGQAMECLIERLVHDHTTIMGKAKWNHVHDLMSKECVDEILRITELQGEDYHQDRPLYFACRSDRDVFCPKVMAEDGQVLQCLMLHKEHGRMSEKCRKILVERSQLMAVDYKISHPLVGACQQHIKKNCARDPHTPEPENKQLNYVLRCLQNTARTTQELGPKCTEQLLKHRQLMMSDFRMSPELVVSCAKEIEENCFGQLVGGGSTLKCLMHLHVTSTCGTPFYHRDAAYTSDNYSR